MNVLDGIKVGVRVGILLGVLDGTRVRVLVGASRGLRVLVGRTRVLVGNRVVVMLEVGENIRVAVGLRVDVGTYWVTASTFSAATVLILENAESTMF